jgi:hypothetical protein
MREGKCINFGRVSSLLSLSRYNLNIFSLMKMGKNSLLFVNGGVKKHLRVPPADKRASNIFFFGGELEKEGL